MRQVDNERANEQATERPADRRRRASGEKEFATSAADVRVAFLFLFKSNFVQSRFSVMKKARTRFSLHLNRVGSRVYSIVLDDERRCYSTPASAAARNFRRLVSLLLILRRRYRYWERRSRMLKSQKATIGMMGVQFWEPRRSLAPSLTHQRKE